MTKPLIQIGDEVREMTDDEYVEYQALQNDLAEQRKAASAKAATRAAALAKLGLTADEVAALFG